MRISDWSSDVCSSDLVRAARKPRNSNGGEGGIRTLDTVARMPHFECGAFDHSATSPSKGCQTLGANNAARLAGLVVERRALANEIPLAKRSEEHTSELQSLMRISYAVFCLKKQNNHTVNYIHIRKE